MLNKIKSNSARLFCINPETPLYRVPLFFAAIAVPLLLCLLLYLAVAINENLKFSFTKDGYDYFWEISKLPLGVLAMVFPLAGLINHIHTSKQKLHRDKSVLFFEHRRYVKETIESYGFEFDNFDAFYCKTYPSNGVGSYEPNGLNSKVRESLTSSIKLIDDQFDNAQIDGCLTTEMINKINVFKQNSIMLLHIASKALFLKFSFPEHSGLHLENLRKLEDFLIYSSSTAHALSGKTRGITAVSDIFQQNKKPEYYLNLSGEFLCEQKRLLDEEGTEPIKLSS
ncbi:hypothetical protein [Vibrio sp. WXL210]|uniref:hypothetical protein n=1 Tax=Vibrio sp. WXL210 TaxID=3450709 RepID=UPI003EC4DBB7